MTDHPICTSCLQPVGKGHAESCPLDGDVCRLVDAYLYLLQAIRLHRDEPGDDRCWLDDEALYSKLPEGYTPPKRDSKVELANCEKFIACRHSERTEYVSPQRRIEELEEQVKELTADLAEAVSDKEFWKGQP